LSRNVKTVARSVDESERPPNGVGKNNEVIWEEKNEKLKFDTDLEELKGA
jgi:hypothetical protein